jgi:hypothetical protein
MYQINVADIEEKRDPAIHIQDFCEFVLRMFD